jgi:hypothetical protein
MSNSSKDLFLSSWPWLPAINTKGSLSSFWDERPSFCSSNEFQLLDLKQAKEPYYKEAKTLKSMVH